MTQSSLRQLDMAVQLEEVDDGLIRQRPLLAGERLLCRATDERRRRTIEAIPAQQIAGLELDEIDQHGIVGGVDLIQEDDEARDADLAREQDMLARLRHWSVESRDERDGAIHLRRAGDHVLHIIGVTGAIDMRVVAVRRRELDMSGRDREDLRRVTGAERG